MTLFPDHPGLRKTLFILAGVFVLLLASVILYLAYFIYNQPKAAFWLPAIEAYEQLDRERGIDRGRVVFAGSSSIRFWDSLATDMAPLKVMNRGFGGANLAHLTCYFDRVVTPYAPAAIVMYAGDNDFGGFSPKSPAAVFKDFIDLVTLKTRRFPDVSLYFIAIKPSPLRWGKWPEMQQANRLIKSFIESRGDLIYLDIATPMLGDDGKPRNELYKIDGLHLSKEGYAVWRAVIKPVLLEDLQGNAIARRWVNHV